MTDARRIEILDAAAELLATRPTASLAEIAAHAKIGKATLHRYFASREALLVELAYRALSVVSSAIENSHIEEGSPIEALIRLTEALVPLGDKLYFLMNEHIWDVDADLAAANEAVEAPVVHLLERGQAAGELRQDVSVAWLGYLYSFALYGVWQAIHDGVVARREAPRLVMETVLHGILAKK